MFAGRAPTVCAAAVQRWWQRLRESQCDSGQHHKFGHVGNQCGPNRGAFRYVENLYLFADGTPDERHESDFQFGVWHGNELCQQHYRAGVSVCWQRNYGNDLRQSGSSDGGRVCAVLSPDGNDTGVQVCDDLHSTVT